MGMNTNKYLKISALCLAFGLLFCAYQQGWIIFRRPTLTSKIDSAQPVATKKAIKLTYWHNGSWHSETTQLIWPAQTARAVEYLVTSWLSQLDEEGITPKKVTIQTVMVTPSGQAYISFDHTPFDGQQTIQEKWLWVEGLLTTIRENANTIQSVRLLARHKPLHDPHLDFTNPWPLHGFFTR